MEGSGSVVPILAEQDDDIKNIVEIVAEVCLSKEFDVLRAELKRLYSESGSEDVEVSAFKDALFVLLLQSDYRLLKVCLKKI